MSDYFRQNATYSTGFSDEKSWSILSNIEARIKSKIEKVGTPLKNWEIKINYGIKTGYNEAFIIDAKVKDELVRKSPESAEIIRPILRGMDIKKFIYTFNSNWLINSHNGIKEMGIDRINVPEQFPVIFEHLTHYEKQLQ